MFVPSGLHSDSGQISSGDTCSTTIYCQNLATLYLETTKLPEMKCILRNKSLLLFYLFYLFLQKITWSSTLAIAFGSFLFLLGPLIQLPWARSKKKKSRVPQTLFFSVCEMLTSAVIKYETRTMHTGIITRPPISMMTSAAVVKKKDLHGRPVCKKKKSKKKSKKNQ